ncbi:phosphoglucosamine mutase [Candidatus Bathyarchaeota archaeon]|nr:phosphoglucosamine mutase [Candidatus Bathyarchaeota archaeon]
MKLFGSSGIRGIANVDITPLLAQKVGTAIASMFEGGAVLIGKDTRLSGEMIELALSSGFVSSGLVVGTLGVIPTPVVAWLTREMQAEAGVSITASHNPPQYNGLKIFDSTGMAYTMKKQERLEELVQKGEFTTSEWNRVGHVEAMDLKRLYIEAISNLIEAPLERRIICDLFNGATTTIAKDLFEELGSQTIMINAQPDGYFPAGNPEPNKESLERLGKMIRDSGAEIGFGFDGDGDRMIPVDENGVTPSPDRVLAAYAGYIVRANGGGTVVTHVGASMSVEEAVEEAEGSVIRTKVGDVHVTEAMLETGAIFGGEPIGAWIHPDVHFCPDGILSAIRLIQALDSEEKTLSQFVSGIPAYPIYRAKVSCQNLKKQAAMDSISNIETEFGEVTNISKVDGVRFQLEDGWVLIRPSGTEPFIRITVEAHDEERAKGLLETSKKFVQLVLGGLK